MLPNLIKNYSNNIIKCCTTINIINKPILLNSFYSTGYNSNNKVKPIIINKKKTFKNQVKESLNFYKDRDVELGFREEFDKKNIKKLDKENNNNSNEEDEDYNDENKDYSSIKTERLQKVLSRSGVVSRRKAVGLIQDGKVKVNGVIANEAGLHVSSIDEIRVNDIVIKKQPPKLWIHFKNTKVLTSDNDPEGRDCLIPILKKVLNKEHLISVGRLDYYSEGIILLTNDGELARHLELPSNEFERRYRVRIFGRLTSEMKYALTKGITIDGIKYKPIKIDIASETDSNTWLDITLQEGKKREIRTMLEFFNVKVLRLIRVAYGPYELPSTLKNGETIEVPIKNELKQFIQKYNNDERSKRNLQLKKKFDSSNINNNNNGNNNE